MREPNSEQVFRMSQALYSLSRVDGHSDREGMLIKAFWMEFSGGDTLSLDLKSLEGEVALARLGDWVPDVYRLLFMETALRLAWADGSVTPAEREWLDEAARVLNISPADWRRLDENVRGELLKGLSHIQNTEALKEVARELGLVGK